MSDNTFAPLPVRKELVLAETTLFLRVQASEGLENDVVF